MGSACRGPKQEKTMSSFKLISVKGTRTFEGTAEQAIAAAKAMDEELQPAYGVSVEDDNGDTVAEVRDGTVEQ
jgi:hypothetical protein